MKASHIAAAFAIALPFAISLTIRGSLLWAEAVGMQEPVSTLVGAQGQGLTSGPWRLEVAAFSVQPEVEIKTVNNTGRTSTERLKAESGAAFALVDVRATRLRTQYARDEIAAFDSSGYMTALRAYTDNKALLESAGFFLTHCAGTCKEGNTTLQFARYMFARKGLEGVETFNAGKVVGIPIADDVEVTLVFGYNPLDNEPMLFYASVPKREQTEWTASRMAVSNGALTSVKYLSVPETRDTAEYMKFFGKK